MAFINDFRDILVNDASIAAEYSPRIYYQLLDKNIDKTKKWLRWGDITTEEIQCIGGQVPYSEIDIFVDLIYSNPNDLPIMGQTIIDKLKISTPYKGIKHILFVNNSYDNYEERDMYVNTLNFKVIY